MWGCALVICKFYIILSKELEHPWIFVSTGACGFSPTGILRNDCVLFILRVYHYMKFTIVVSNSLNSYDWAWVHGAKHCLWKHNQMGGFFYTCKKKTWQKLSKAGSGAPRPIRHWTPLRLSVLSFLTCAFHLQGILIKTFNNSLWLMACRLPGWLAHPWKTTSPTVTAQPIFG